jgi:hypothetical protein
VEDYQWDAALAPIPLVCLTENPLAAYTACTTKFIVAFKFRNCSGPYTASAGGLGAMSE